jgi:hypothetical protein
MMSEVKIQYQNSGVWNTMTRLPSNSTSQRITREMQALKKNNPSLRVRAVDSKDQLIDILP